MFLLIKMTINNFRAASGFPLVVASCLVVSETCFKELPLVALKTRPKTHKPLQQATATIPAAKRLRSKQLVTTDGVVTNPTDSSKKKENTSC